MSWDSVDLQCSSRHLVLHVFSRRSRRTLFRWISNGVLRFPISIHCYGRNDFYFGTVVFDTRYFQVFFMFTFQFRPFYRAYFSQWNRIVPIRHRVHRVANQAVRGNVTVIMMTMKKVLFCSATRIIRCIWKEEISITSKEKGRKIKYV